MSAYYNEIEPKAAAWLRELVKQGHIADGEVDERDIQDVTAADLRGFSQCHFFAGIGVWSYALRRSGWADDRPVWTGSAPCQPFSAAGKGAGFDDERHLWPAFYWLIEQCRPPVIFGEQVASKDAEPWIDLVQADLEDVGYAFGAVAFPSAGIGAPHIRDRTYWLADASGGGRGELGHSSQPGRVGGLADAGGARAGRDAGAASGAQASVRGARHPDGRDCGDTLVAGGAVRGLADAGGDGRSERPEQHGSSAQPGQQAPFWHDDAGRGGAGGLADTGREHGEWRAEAERLGEPDATRRWEDTVHDQPRGLHGRLADADLQRQRSADHSARIGDAPGPGETDRVGDTERFGWERRGTGDEDERASFEPIGGSRDGGRLADAAAARHAEARQHERGPSQLPARPAEHGRVGGLVLSGTEDGTGAEGGHGARDLAAPAGPVNGLWRDADWLYCRDGIWRPVEPGTFPLAHGAAARVGRLRGYGNAINAEAAVAWIESYLAA